MTDTRSSIHNPPLGSGIELRHLRYFLAVYDELHFSRAAALLHLAQPALSLAIQRLEERLGVTLFERTSRSVTPTPAGRVLASQARCLMEGFDRAVAETRRTGGAVRSLRIGCLHDVPLDLLLRFVCALSEYNSRPTQVSHLPAAEQLRRLRQGELELGIFYDTAGDDRIRTRPLSTGHPMSALVPAPHPLAAKDVLTPDDLRGEVLLTVSRSVDSALHERIVTLADRAGYRFGAVHNVGGAETRDLIPAVAQNLGIALAPWAPSEMSAHGIVERPLDPALRMPQTVVGWQADRGETESLVVEALQELSRRFAA
jgi:DNA-binding transcriptional LysR family regulator